MSDKPCSKCGQHPRVPRNTVCRECLNALMMQRYYDELAGIRPTGICPCCKMNQRKPGGSYCVDCHKTKARIRSRRARGLSGDGKPQPEKKPVRAGLKYCTGCGRALAPELFDRARNSPDGRRSQCKMCRSDYQRELRRKNKLRYRAAQRRYYRNNTEKVLARLRLARARRKLAKLSNRAKELGL